MLLRLDPVILHLEVILSTETRHRTLTNYVVLFLFGRLRFSVPVIHLGSFYLHQELMSQRWFEPMSKYTKLV